MTIVDAHLLGRAAAGDNRAAAAVLCAWDARITGLARANRRPGVDIEDIHAAAVEGVLLGLKHYDSARGGGWAYLEWYAKKAIYRAIREALPGLVMAESEYMRDGAPSVASMDAPISDDGGQRCRHEVIAADARDVGAEIDDGRRSRALAMAVLRLPPRQAAIVRLLHGIADERAYVPRDATKPALAMLRAIEAHGAIHAQRPRRAKAPRTSSGHRFARSAPRDLARLALAALRAHPRRRNELPAVLRARRGDTLRVVSDLERRGLVEISGGLLVARAKQRKTRDSPGTVEERSAA